MDFRLLPLCEEDIADYKKDMQKAFQMGAGSEFGEFDTEILPEKDIDRSLSAKGAIAYKAILDRKMVGGAIVVIDDITHRNHLVFLYVKYGIQSKGIGQAIWNEVEKLYPDTNVWETITPYHKDQHIPDDMVGGDYFFRFEKVMK